ncbi:MAG TPA: hypothetical protein VFJ16_20205 [Longimicrobium sp.]|nr:hypothetical protein [Longimicrobium sp.]
MFSQFQGQQNNIATRTDLRVVLQDPEQPEGTFTKELSFSAEGTMRVVIGNMFQTTAKALAGSALKGADPDEPRFVLPWSVSEMFARADTEIGEVTVTNVAGRPTLGTVKQLTGDSPFPALLEAEVCATLNIAGIGEIRTATAVPIRAEINSIPPFGTEAAHANSGLLVDANGTARGMITGRSITLVGPAEA